MTSDLDRLKDEIQEYLSQQGFVTFYAYSRAPRQNAVRWDTATRPDFREFLGAARLAEVKMVVLTAHTFEDHADDALETLESFELPRDDQRAYERRLRELKAYEGFTCEVEMSFDHGSATYVYDVRTEWFNEFLNIMDEINALLDDDGEEEDSGIGGYFSRN